jgi:TolB-like protein/cytochrome c-type biogenesis protein CcmH/NrfG
VTGQNKAVFLSYASQDAEAAKNLSDALRVANIEVWFDQSELRGGDAWDQKIRQQIRDCALFVPIISAHTQARPEGYFRLEWKLAVDRSHLMAAEKAFLMPVVVDATTQPDALVPMQFRDVQWTSIRAGEAPPAFVDHILALLNQPVASHVGNSKQGVRNASARSPPITLLTLSVAAVAALVITMAMRGGWLSPKSVPKVEASAASTPVANAPTAIFEKSVAVLPFVDMSQKKDQEYFSDGLSEELIDLLSRVPDLRVPARTSSFYFKGKAAKIADIGKELSVAHVLEGSIRKSGNTVRVTVQLIRVDSGFHVWSETYDRPLNDIFKVQDEIAASVVSSLKISLLKGAVPTVNGTSSSEAYDIYLRAKSMAHTLSAYESKPQMEKVVEYLHGALRLDPAYVEAWTLLSQVLSDQALYGYISGAPIREAAHQAAMKALAANPNSSDSHTAMARVYMLLDRDWAAALAQVRQALALDPNDSWALVCEGMIEVYGGRPDSGIPRLERSVSIDPINESRYQDLAVAYYAAGRYADAAMAYRNVLDLDPSLNGVHSALAEVLLATDGPAAALDENNRESDAESREVGEAVIYFAQGRKSDADLALAKVEKNYAETDACDIARIHAYRAEIEAAFSWLGRVRQPHCVLSKVDPFFKILRPDPRFKAFLRNMGLPK